MGRFYKTTATPTVDYAYEYPFKELMQAVEYRQKRQDAALSSLYTAKDKLTNIDYVPGSPDEAFLKNLQKQFDDLLESSVGTDLSLNQGALMSEIDKIAGHPRLADIQYNAEFTSAQNAIAQELQAKELLGPDSVPDYASMAGDPNQLRIPMDQTVSAYTDPRDNLESYFDNIDETMAIDWDFMKKHAINSVPEMLNTGWGINAVNQNRSRFPGMSDEEIMTELSLETAKEYYQRAAGSQQGGPGGGGGIPPGSQNSYYVEEIINPFINEIEGGGDGEIAVGHDFFDLIYPGSETNKPLHGGRYRVTGGTDNVYMGLTPIGNEPMLHYDKNSNTYSLVNKNDQSGIPYNHPKAIQDFIAMSALDQFYKSPEWLEFVDGTQLSDDLMFKVDESSEQYNEDKANMDRLANVLVSEHGIDPRVFDVNGNIMTDELPQYSVYKDMFGSDNDLKSNFSLKLSKNLKGTQYDFTPTDGENTFFLNGELMVSGLITLSEEEANSLFEMDARWRLTGKTDWHDLFVKEMGIVNQSGDGKEGYTYTIPVYKAVHGEQVSLMHDYDQTRMGDKLFNESRYNRKGELNRSLQYLENINIGQQFNYNRDFSIGQLNNKLSIFSNHSQGISGGGGAGPIDENLITNGKAQLQNYYELSTEYLSNIDPSNKETVENKLLTLYDNIVANNNPDDIKEFSELFYTLNFTNNRLENLNTKTDASTIKSLQDQFKSQMNYIGVVSGYNGGIDNSATSELFGIRENPNNLGTYTVDTAKFNNAIAEWAVENDHTFVDGSKYPNINWTSGLSGDFSDLSGSRVSAPYTTDGGRDILSKANSWAAENNIQLNINSMARPQIVQDILITKTDMAANNSRHKDGAIDFKNLGTHKQTQAFIDYMSKWFIIDDHDGDHIHIHPKN